VLPARNSLKDLQDTHPEMEIRLLTERGQPPGYVAQGVDERGHDFTVQSGTVEGLRSQIEGPLVEFDESRPSVPRVYDYWLGGSSNFAADRELAGKIEEAYPGTREMVIENRHFLVRAIRFVMSTGISQVIDVGAGLPASPAVHDIAREVVSAARVAYVDNEMMVIRHLQAEIGGRPGLAAVPADLRYPGAVWARPELDRVIDTGQPVLLILAFVLHFHDAAAARRIASGFARLLAPGSWVIITVATGDTRIGAQISEAYTAGTIHNHSERTFRAFFDGLEVYGPGLVDARAWHPHGPAGPIPGREAIVLAGVARKPVNGTAAAGEAAPSGYEAAPSGYIDGPETPTCELQS
jgi:hypothetical protein